MASWESKNSGNNSNNERCSNEATPHLFKESDQKYRLLLELSEDGIIIVQNGVIRESNYSLAKMCGYDLEEVVDTCFASYFHSKDMAAVELLGEVSLKDPNAVETLKATLVCKSAYQLQVEITAARCTIRQKPAIICNIRDVSPPLATEAEINKHRTLDSIAALSGGIAHDYNNLLTAIIGNITLAQTYLSKDEKPSRLLHHALAASETARNLTQKLITFSKGGLPNKQVSAVDRLVKSAVEFTLSGSNIKSSYRFASDLSQFNVDQSQIGQAIHNIVMNAREAMPEGGRLEIVAKNIAITDEINTLPSGNYVQVSIADQGCGIAAEEFDKIFEPYYSTKDMENQKGTGLGLSICHSIITKHGGGVSLESRIGVGTTFNIYLPATRAKPTLKPTHTEPVGNRRIFGEGTILVMDDDQSIRELAGEILQHLGYRVEFARDGAEAVALYQAALNSTKPFDAVILDLTVRGGMGGKEAIKKLLAIDPRVKGIVSSGYSEDPGITGYEQHGFHGVVAKPYTLEELGEKLSRVLRGMPR